MKKESGLVGNKQGEQVEEEAAAEETAPAAE